MVSLRDCHAWGNRALARAGCDAALERGPARVNLRLNMRDLFFAQVAEASLPAQIRFDRIVRVVYSEPPALAILHLEEREHAVLDRHAREFDRLVVATLPPWRAGREDVQEPRAAQIASVRRLGKQVHGIGNRGGRRVGNPVRREDAKNVLLVACFRMLRRRGRGPRAPRRGRRPLDAGVHVRFVVVTAVEDVLVALRPSRQRLQADVERAAIANPHEHGGVRLSAYVERSAHARRNGRAGRERRVVERNLERRLRPGSGDDREATRRHDDDRIGAERLEYEAHRQWRRTPGTGEVSRCHQLASRDLLTYARLTHGFTPTQRSSRSDFVLCRVRSITSSITAGVMSRPPNPRTYP